MSRALGGLLAAAVLTACAARTPALRTRGVVDAVSTADALDRALTPRRVALLIGIDHYEDPAFPDLVHARDDAQALGAALRDESAGFDEVVVLEGGGGTDRAAILDELRRLRTGLRRDDEVLVFFAGHGTRAPSGPGDWHRFLLPSDARTADLEGTAVDLEDLLDWFQALPALRKGIIVDACFDGGGRSVANPGARGADDLPEGPVSPVREARLGPGDAQLFATTPGRPSLEDDQVGHGVYTWYLLEALGWGFQEADRDEDGALTLWEAHDHARGRVLAHTDGLQVPEAVLRTVGEADVVLRESPAGRQRREGALLYLYAGDGHPYAGAELSIDGRTRGALPGTHPVAPGRHRVVVRGEGGEVLEDRHVTFRSGRAYEADDLAGRAGGAAGGVVARTALIALPGMTVATGAGGLGVEALGYGRVRTGPAQGLMGGARLWAGATVGAVGGALPGRAAVQGGVFLGWQGDVRSVRLRPSWGASLLWLPPRRALAATRPNVADAVTQGWLVASTGPSLDVSYVISDGWSLGGGVRVEGAAIPDGLGGVGFVPVIGVGAGVEATF